MNDLMFASVRWVITAYHCVSSNLTTWEGTLQPTDVRVILGLHTFSHLGSALVFNVSSIFAAPNRQDVPKEALDVALLQIDGDIDIRYHENIFYVLTVAQNISLFTPICLPSSTDSFYTLTTVATGWGLNVSTTNNDTSATTPDMLQVCIQILSTQSKI